MLISHVPSPQDVRGMPVRPPHPATGAGSRQRPSTAPSSISPSPAGSLAATRPWQTFGSEVSYQSLTARMTDHLIQDSPRLMICSSHESVKTPLVSSLHLPPSRVP